MLSTVHYELSFEAAHQEKKHIYIVISAVAEAHPIYYAVLLKLGGKFSIYTLLFQMSAQANVVLRRRNGMLLFRLPLPRHNSIQLRAFEPVGGGKNIPICYSEFQSCSPGENTYIHCDFC